MICKEFVEAAWKRVGGLLTLCLAVAAVICD